MKREFNIENINTTLWKIWPTFKADSYLLTLISMLICDKNERGNGTKVQIEQLSVSGFPRTEMRIMKNFNMKLNR